MTSPAGFSAQAVLVPCWLTGADREELAQAVRATLDTQLLHPVAAIHLADVLTELHVATVRELIWPASAARVRRATGWSEDVLPVRLSAAELASLLTSPSLPAAVHAALTDGRIE